MIRVRSYNAFLRFILPRWVRGISLWPFGIYFRDADNVAAWQVNHEWIHWRQQREMGGLFFYAWYLVEWILKLPLYGRYAYSQLSFEREAFRKDEDLLYKHPFYGWIKYIIK